MRGSIPIVGCDLIICSETWLSSAVNDCELGLNEFSIIEWIEMCTIVTKNMAEEF